jgi:transcriptional regulator with XRE-family HTH domain
MKKSTRFIEINGRELRSRRLARGWTQLQLARSAGYSERLIRKAEKGGTLDIATIQDIAEALSAPDHAVSVDSLTVDIAAIAKRWVESWEQLEVRMVPEVESLLAEGFEFVCPGEPGIVPFTGTFKGTDGMQEWLDLYFSCVQRTKNIEVEYMVGEDTVLARWLEHGTFLGMPAPPVRINMHFRFIDGLIVRIVDDYDTQTAATTASTALSRQIELNPQVVSPVAV